MIQITELSFAIVGGANLHLSFARDTKIDLKTHTQPNDSGVPPPSKSFNYLENSKFTEKSTAYKAV